MRGKKIVLINALLVMTSIALFVWGLLDTINMVKSGGLGSVFLPVATKPLAFMWIGIYVITIILEGIYEKRYLVLIISLLWFVVGAFVAAGFFHGARNTILRLISISMFMVLGYFNLREYKKLGKERKMERRMEGQRAL